MPPATVAFILSPRHELRAFAQLPRVQQSFRPRYSRASCFWSHIQVPGQSRFSIQFRKVRGCQIERVGLFSTSVARMSEHKHSYKQNPEASSNKLHEQPQPPPPSTTAKLASTLKSKLAPVRHEQIYNIPNILTFSRLIATPVIGYLIINNHHLYAFGLFLYAGISDLLDGWIARKWKLQTVVGSVVDPMADKALMTTLVTCLAINGSLPLPLATLMLGRDVSLAIAAIYYRYASLPPPKTMTRYWDFSLPSAEVHPTTISKLNTFLQLILIGTTISLNLLHDPSATSSAAGGLLLSTQEILGGPGGVDRLVKGMSGIVAGTTIYSGLEYVWTKKAVTILGDDEALKRRQGARGRLIIGSAFGAVIGLAGWLWYRDLTKAEEQKEEKE